MAYGCAALNAWGVAEFLEFARRRVGGIYYDEGGEGCSGDGDQKGSQRKCHSEHKARRRLKRVGYHAVDHSDSSDSDVGDIILGLWTHNAKKARRQAQAKKVEDARESPGMA